MTLETDDETEVMRVESDNDQWVDDDVSSDDDVQGRGSPALSDGACLNDHFMTQS